jgi:hypothetical protein
MVDIDVLFMKESMIQRTYMQHYSRENYRYDATEVKEQYK